MHSLPGIVFPSSPAPADALSAGAVFLPKHRMFPVEAGEFSFLAGPDAQRTEKLCEALADPDVGILVAARGGHGALRLNREKIVSALQRFPKPIAGFSDVTALHFLWATAGVPSFFGPNVTQLPHLPEEQRRRFLQLLSLNTLDAADVDLMPLTPLPAERIRAPLCAANLTVAASAAGTCWSFSWKGKIVVLEEVREAAYRVDRMLWQLFHATDLAHAAALVLGEFTECPGFRTDWIVRACEDWAPRLPVLSGFPCGHGQSNLVFRFGCMAELASSGHLSIPAWIPGDGA